MFEERLTHDEELERIIGKIRATKPKEAKELVTILSGVEAKCEYQRMIRFIVILKAFQEPFQEPGISSRKRQYALGRAMLAILSSEARNFVLQVLEENVFRCPRLNTLCRLEYYSFEVTVLLDSLLASPRDSPSLQTAAESFQRYQVLELIEFVSLHSPEEIVERMRECDAFRGNLTVPDPESCFALEKKREFIAFLCEKLSIDVPSVCLPLFARIRLAGEFRIYEEGRTEISDFYQICVAYAKNDENAMSLVTALVAEKSNPLSEFFCQMTKFSFARNPSAGDFSPSCVENDALHGLACDRHYFLTGVSTVGEFDQKLGFASDVAVTYHQNTIGGKRDCDFIVFHTFNRMYCYSVELSRHLKTDVIRVLVKNRDIKVYVYKKEMAIQYLRMHLGWTPRNLIDAKEVAQHIGIGSRIEDLTEKLVGGRFCCRAMNFCGASTPSQTALRHLDILGSLIFTFCHRFSQRSEVPRRGRASQRRDDDRRPTATSDRSRSRY